MAEDASELARGVVVIDNEAFHLSMLGFHGFFLAANAAFAVLFQDQRIHFLQGYPEVFRVVPVEYLAPGHA